MREREREYEQIMNNIVNNDNDKQNNDYKYMWRIG